MERYKILQSEAVHRLATVFEAQLCARLRQCLRRDELHVSVPAGEYHGWVSDFWDIRSALYLILGQLGHYSLNEIEGRNDTTSENVANWTWRRLTLRVEPLLKGGVIGTCTRTLAQRRARMIASHLICEASGG